MGCHSSKHQTQVCVPKLTTQVEEPLAAELPPAQTLGEEQTAVEPPATTPEDAAQVTLPLPVRRPKQAEDGEASPVGMPHAPSAPAIREPTAASPPAAGSKAKRNLRPAVTMPANLQLSSNGFQAIPEINSFSCAEENIAPYTMPLEAFNYHPTKDAIVCVFKNGDSERKIHLNVELTESEIHGVAQMRQEAKAEDSKFYPSVTAMATRFLSRARMDSKRAVKLMAATQEWRKTYFKDGPVTDAEVMEDMKHGIVYFSGRDYAMRPVIVVRANRIPQQWYKDKCIDRFIRMLIFCMEYFTRYMVVPGKVENLNVIVDLAGLGISQVPIGALAEVYGVMSQHYIGRVYKFYVVHMSYMLSSIAGLAKAILTDRQKQKLNMLDKESDLLQDFALHQLEEDLGGSRPQVTRFFPFPLVPGPFTAGYAGGPDATAAPDAHQVLTHAGALGQLWDPKLSVQDNTKLSYGPRAAHILEKAGLPVPPEARFEEIDHHADEEAAEESGFNAVVDAPEPEEPAKESESDPKLGSRVSTDAGTPMTLAFTDVEASPLMLQKVSARREPKIEDATSSTCCTCSL